MKRSTAALLVLVALLAACGSSAKAPTSTPATTTAAAPPTPAAYRAQMNGLCVHAKQELGKTSTKSATSQASAVAALEKALGIFQPILTTAQGITPPSSLAAGHRKLLTSLKELVDGGNALVAKLKAGTSLTKALTPASVKSLGLAVAGLKGGFTTLGLTTCSKLVGGK